MALETFLRNDRVVIYTPNLRYRGPDYFTYIIHDGLSIQNHIGENGNSVLRNEVTMHVRNCRTYDTKQQFNRTNGVHPLCTCGQTEVALVNNVTYCNSIRTKICADAFSNEAFYNMCQACFGKNSALGLISSECIAQTIRSVSLLSSRGLCSTKPIVDCSTETVTAPGLEATNYLSLKPYTSDGSMSLLGNSFGGYGWYQSSTLQ
jgi:hypothetical protein